jgi:hypothetical protein
MLASDLIAENKQLREQLKAACNKLMSMKLKPKDLTDEEIDNISDEIPHYIDTYMGRRMFARAILIKAQEK